jgi:hypothetical protein
MTGLDLLGYIAVTVVGIIGFAAVMWVVGWIFGFGDSDDSPYSGGWRY